MTKNLNNYKKIDWSFPNESSNGHITSLHPYPARFIPAIPRSILNCIKEKNLTILDPFAGCGTSLVVALEEGHNVVGIDVNGIASLLQRVYTHNYSKKELADFVNLTDIIKKSSNEKLLKKDDSLSKLIPNVDHWFCSPSRIAISKTISAIKRGSYSGAVKDLALFSLSRIIVRVSRQKSDTQYVAVSKERGVDDIVKIILGSFAIVGDSFKNQINNHTKGKSLVVHGDARSKANYKKIKNVDLVITSPPYPNAYEYWLYHKYRMYWLDLDPIWSRTNEIGARPHYSGTGKKNEWDFEKDIVAVMKNVYAATKPTALQFWVIGDSVIKGKIIDNSAVIDRACKQTGWKIIDRFERKLNRGRSSFQGVGRQNKEIILVIAKDK